MKVFYSFVFFCIICLCSCKENAANNNNSKTDSVGTMKMASDSNAITAAVEDTATAAKPIDWAGTYKTAYYDGYDQTEVMLHNDSTYMYTAKYFGAKARTVKLHGTFTWTATGAIRLNDAKYEPADYLLKDNVLTQVNKDPKSQVLITLIKEK